MTYTRAETAIVGDLNEKFVAAHTSSSICKQFLMQTPNDEDINLQKSKNVKSTN